MAGTLLLARTGGTPLDLPIEPRGQFRAHLRHRQPTSALSINPVRHSQYLIGAGLGSANNSRVSSSTACQHASAASRSPAAISLQISANVVGLEMGGRQDGAVGAVAQRLMILRVLAGQDREILRPPAQQIERLARSAQQSFRPDDVRMFGERSIASLPRLTPVR